MSWFIYSLSLSKHKHLIIFPIYVNQTEEFYTVETSDFSLIGKIYVTRVQWSIKVTNHLESNILEFYVLDIMNQIERINTFCLTSRKCGTIVLCKLSNLNNWPYCLENIERNIDFRTYKTYVLNEDGETKFQRILK